MGKLQELLLGVSRKWRWVVAFVVLNFASFGILFALEGAFEALTSTPVYDTQNDLTQAQILEQLPLYQGEARDAYLRFAAFDFVFPLVSALFITLIWTLLLRLNRGRIAARLLAWRVPLLPLLITLFDYLENVGLLLVLAAAPSPDPALMEFALAFKRLKLFGLALVGPATIVIAALLAADVAGRLRLRRAAGRAVPSEAV
jgi:hypothetical protein